ncbi:N-acetyltransferase family protein [Micromonospora sp. URMC 105]|uniref:GNAT family N-acetyltransferase n=1 Tax=Micromonospora sp. URMC 105 TaxID=3423413 RepID=UPI003F1A0A6F
MIRPSTPEDAAHIVELVVAAEMFTADDAPFVEEMMAGYFALDQAQGHRCLVDADSDLVGVAYYQPKIAADRVWDLSMIAVRPDRQGQGRGSTLIRHIEDDLRERGQRLLLVDTSGTPQYDRTRGFYRRCGYDEEARIRDYWQAGDDLVVYRKALAS